MPSSPTVKVILVGIQKSGTSFLANVLLGENRFSFFYMPSVNTTDIQTARMTLPLPRQSTTNNDECEDPQQEQELLIYNIPGITFELEPLANAATCRRNHNLIKEAFSQHPEMPTIILYVSVTALCNFSEFDYRAWTALVELLQGENLNTSTYFRAATRIIFNQFELDRFHDTNGFDKLALSRYSELLKDSITQILGKNCWSGDATFIDKVSDCWHFEGPIDFSCSKIATARQTLIDTVRSLLPHATRIVPGKDAKLIFKNNELYKARGALKSFYQLTRAARFQSFSQDTRQYEQLVEEFLTRKVDDLEWALSWRYLVRNRVQNMLRQHSEISSYYRSFRQETESEFNRITHEFVVLQRKLEQGRGLWL